MKTTTTTNIGSAIADAQIVSSALFECEEGEDPVDWLDKDDGNHGLSSLSQRFTDECIYRSACICLL